MAFIKLTHPNDTEVWINPNYITSIRKDGDYTQVFLPVRNGGSSLCWYRVKESPQQIAGKISTAERNK